MLEHLLYTVTTKWLRYSSISDIVSFQPFNQVFSVIWKSLFKDAFSSLFKLFISLQFNYIWLMAQLQTENMPYLALSDLV